MASTNRTARLTKLYRVLKKHYKPVSPTADRPVLEQLLFASCLANTPYQKAEEAFACLGSGFFDWNEIRVSTVKELAEVLDMLPDSGEAASNVKRILQSVFESTYSFDLENIHKKNLGQAIARLQRFDGTTPFSVSFAIQNSLGGHAIPVDRGALGALAVLDLVTERDMKAGVVPGLERAIAKNKGVEFASLLHQLSADFAANPYSPSLHKILLQANPSAKSRLPRRPTKKQIADAKREAARAKRQAERDAAAKEEAAKAKKATSKSKAAKAQADGRAKTATKKTAAAAKKTTAAKKKAGTKKTHSRRLAKRKPR